MLNLNTGEKLPVPFINLECVETCVSRLKCNKAAGCDGTMSEHIVYGGKDLLVHLCLVFSAFLRHCFVPADFCVGLIIPPLKNRHGDA